MYALVSDIEAYPRFLPWCSATHVLSREGEALVASIAVDFGGIQKRFTTRNEGRANRTLAMTLLDGPFSRLDGRWQFEAIDERASKVSLQLDFEFANRLVGFAISPAFSRIANTLVDSFRQRAEEIYGKR